MNGRKTGELYKVDAQGAVKAQSSSAAAQHDSKQTVEQCQNGVCAVTWKPAKPAAA